jgi:myo-inositol 2-dehydrogenase/D-chiro-inositol 1-dehydrogenase
LGNNNKVRLGVIGVGRIGKIHIENLIHRINGTDVVAVSDINKNELEKVAKQYNISSNTTDYKDILKQKDVDAIVLCSPTDTHALIIQEAADAQKHIFCEKPIDLTLEKIKSTIDNVEKNNVKFFVGFNRRFDPNFKKVYEITNSGKIGQPQILKITSRDPAPPPLEYIKTSGGILLDMTIHDFDMARYLVGSEVVEVFTIGNVLVDPVFKEAGDLDTIITVLKFENGAIGTIDNSRKAVYGYDQRVEVFGSKGMVNVNNNTPDNHVYLDKEGVHSALPLNFFMERYTESYLAEMNAFLECIIKDTLPKASGNDGMIAVAIGLAAMKSIKENRPVKMSEII